MVIDENKRRRLIEAVAGEVIANAEKLTQLDQSIGDGDHGINMKRGFQAVLDDIDAIAAKALPDALKATGMQLVMKVGGASGPLYGTLIMTLGKNLSSDQPTASEFSSALAAAVEAVKARGKSEAGQKTMLDVLVPLSDVLINADEHALQTLPDVAGQLAEATVPMQATKGRASFLGERSIGHMDPGACSTALIAAAVCGAIKGAADER